MIRPIIGLFGGLEKSYLATKTTVKITEVEIKKKRHNGEIELE